MAKSNAKKNEALAMDIYNWCVKNKAWQCYANITYFNGKALASFDKWNGIEGKKIAKNLYEYADKNPCDYFEYGNQDTVSMSFDGSELYYILNYYFDFDGYTELFNEFNELFEKHGFYFELGNSWNLSAYEL